MNRRPITLDDLRHIDPAALRPCRLVATDPTDGYTCDLDRLDDGPEDSPRDFVGRAIDHLSRADVGAYLYYLVPIEKDDNQ